MGYVTEDDVGNENILKCLQFCAAIWWTVKAQCLALVFPMAERALVLEMDKTSFLQKPIYKVVMLFLNEFFVAMAACLLHRQLTAIRK